MTERLLLKGRAAILTPEAPGLNIARGLPDAALRAGLTSLASAAMDEGGPNLGLILRSAAAEADDNIVGVAALRAEWEALQPAAGSAPACLRPAPGAAAERGANGRPRRRSPRPDRARRRGIWEEVDALRSPQVTLGGAG